MKIAGQRRGESYPVGSGGGGGGGSGSVPLSRQRFIDGGTAQLGLTGSASEPFKTIAQFMASRGNVSIADATANYVGWLMPSINGYTEAVSFPPYASTELRADSLSLLLGVAITGNVTWANVGGANAATVANTGMHNVALTGNITITDDAGAPASNFYFTGDQIAGESAILVGNIDATGATHLSGIFFNNATVNGTVLGGTAIVTAFNTILVDVTTGALGAQDSTLKGNLTLTNGGTFSNCSFQNNPVLTCGQVSTFDGPSWMSFVANGGTRGAGTKVLLDGGYNAAPVEGAALPTGAGPTNVSLDGTGATAGYTGENSGNHYSSAGLTAGSVVKLLTGGGEKEGDTLLISKTDLAAFSLTVQNNAGATIAVIPANERGFVLARFSVGASDWLFSEGGSLAA